LVDTNVKSGDIRGTENGINLTVAKTARVKKLLQQHCEDYPKSRFR
jgi:hypothetical protein